MLAAFLVELFNEVLLWFLMLAMLCNFELDLFVFEDNLEFLIDFIWETSEALWPESFLPE